MIRILLLAWALLFFCVSPTRASAVTDVCTAVDCVPPTLIACANAHYFLVPILLVLSIVGIALGFSLCVELYRYRRDHGGRGQ